MTLAMHLTVLTVKLFWQTWDVYLLEKLAIFMNFLPIFISLKDHIGTWKTITNYSTHVGFIRLILNWMWFREVNLIRYFLPAEEEQRLSMAEGLLMIFCLASCPVFCILFYMRSSFHCVDKSKTGLMRITSSTPACMWCSAEERISTRDGVSLGPKLYTGHQAVTQVTYFQCSMCCVF